MAGVSFARWTGCNGNCGMQLDFGSLGMAEDVGWCLPAFLRVLAKAAIKMPLCESGHD